MGYAGPSNEVSSGMQLPPPLPGSAVSQRSGVRKLRVVRRFRVAQRSGAAVWTALLLGPAVASGGCTALTGDATRISEGLIGRDARAIRQCLGDAPYFEVNDDGSEVWAYTFATPEEGQNVEVSLASGQGTAYQRPLVETGSATERRNASEETKRIAERSVDRGRCLHVFRVADGTVQSYVGRGRSASGLNADSICISLLSPCVPAR